MLISGFVPHGHKFRKSCFPLVQPVIMRIRFNVHPSAIGRYALQAAVRRYFFQFLFSAQVIAYVVKPNPAARAFRVANQERNGYGRPGPRAKYLAPFPSRPFALRSLVSPQMQYMNTGEFLRKAFA